MQHVGGVDIIWNMFSAKNKRAIMMKDSTWLHACVRVLFRKLLFCNLHAYK
jgi:hypothetical protein